MPARSALAATIGLALVLPACGGRNPSSPATPDVTPAAAVATATPTATTRSDLPAAADFSLRTFDGGTFRLSAYRGQLPVVLNFWAPW